MNLYSESGQEEIIRLKESLHEVQEDTDYNLLDYGFDEDEDEFLDDFLGGIKSLPKPVDKKI